MAVHELSRPDFKERCDEEPEQLCAYVARCTMAGTRISRMTDRIDRTCLRASFLAIPSRVTQGSSQDCAKGKPKSYTANLNPKPDIFKLRPRVDLRCRSSRSQTICPWTSTLLGLRSKPLLLPNHAARRDMDASTIGSNLP